MNKEREVYRLCHQDFAGKSTREAALVMGVTQRRVQQLLNSLKKKAPQLFPILTQIQARDYHLYVTEGWSLADIAENTDRAVSTVQESIAAAVKKGMPEPPKKRGMLRYSKSMDDKVREKF